MKKIIGEIMSAIESQDVKKVSRLFDERPDLLTQKAGNNGDSWLHYAAWYGDEKIVSFLIERGLPVNDLNRSQMTPLIDAIRNDNISIARLLLESGTDPALGLAENGWTALHWAAKCIGAGLLIQEMVQKKAVVDARDPDGMTPLCVAAQYGSCENIQALLMMGANPRHKTSKNHTPEYFCRHHVQATSLIKGWINAQKADQVIKGITGDPSNVSGLRPLGFVSR